MRFKLRQPDARRRYARRKTIVEPVFIQLENARAFTTLSLRGLVTLVTVQQFTNDTGQGTL